MTDNPFIDPSESERAERRVETRETPKTPEQLANDYLIEGGRMTDELKTELEALRARPDLGAADRKTVQELERETEEAHQELRAELAGERLTAEEAADLASQMAVDPEAVARLDAVANATREHEAARKDIEDRLASEVGPVYAKRLLDDTAFRASVLKLHGELYAPLSERGPFIMREAILRNALAVHEIMGPDAAAAVRANDLMRYAEGLAPGIEAEDQVLRLDRLEFDNETGELSLGELNLDLVYKTDEGKGARVNRKFHAQRIEEGDESRTQKTVHHEIFELPPNLRGEAVAAKLLQASLGEYDKMGIEKITLTANINVGAYAWASYGFDWDREKMDNESIKDLAKAGRDTLEIVTQQLGILDFEYNGETGEEKAVFKTGNRTTDQELERAFRAFNEAESPQDLALIGKDGPFFCRSSEGDWFLLPTMEEAKEKYAELRANGQEDEDYPGIMHPGKLGLMRQNWYAGLELRKDGSDQGKHRALFEQALKRRLNK